MLKVTLAAVGLLLAAQSANAEVFVCHPRDWECQREARHESWLERQRERYREWRHEAPVYHHEPPAVYYR